VSRGEPERAVLAACLERGARAWPTIEVSAGELRHFLESKAGGRLSASALSKLQIEDLYLVCACLSGNAAALALFDEHFLAHVPDFVARIRPTAEFAQEVRQNLRIRLFLREGAQDSPRLASYRGSGPLGGWVRVAAIRVARNLVRGQRKSADRQAADEFPLDTKRTDPELRFLAEHYRPALRAAFRDTLESLSTRERNVLRLYFLDGMTSEAIGTMYGSHGSTVRLWIKQARQGILEHTCERLAAELELPREDVHSLIALLRSRLDVSLSAFLKTSPRVNERPRKR
jgi:RNA polymerase sigma-70 factor, ECF subfamily